MRKSITIIAAVAMAVALLASSAVAGGHEWDDTTPHAHVMLVGADVDDGMLTFRKCVDLEVNENARTSNGALPTPAHHHSLHTGTPGGSPFAGGPLFQAGNWVLPMFPYLPAEFGFFGCESFTSGMPSPF